MKMKISSWVAAVMMAVAFTSNTVGQVEKTLPVGSRATLASEALRQVKNVYGSVYGPGSLQPLGGQSWFYFAYNTPTPSAEEIKSLVAQYNLSFRVINPSNDWLSFYFTCYAGDGANLFNGGSGFRLEYGKGGWHVPESARDFEPYLNYTVPLRIKGAIGARILRRDASGNPQSELYLSVSYNNQTDIGTVSFISEYAGTHDQLIVTYRVVQPDGSYQYSDAVYSMENDGAMIATTDVTSSFRSRFHDIVSLPVPYAYMTNVPSNSRVGTVPLGEMNVPYAMWVYLHADTSEGDTATTVRLLKLGTIDAQWREVNIPVGGPPYVPVFLESGLYHVDYEIPALRPPEPYDGTSTGGGGGGKG